MKSSRSLPFMEFSCFSIFFIYSSGFFQWNRFFFISKNGSFPIWIKTFQNILDGVCPPLLSHFPPGVFLRFAAQRSAVIQEILQTERTYVKGLSVLCDVFFNPMRLTPKHMLLKRRKTGQVMDTPSIPSPPLFYCLFFRYY